MTKNPISEGEISDALSLILRRLRLRAEVFLHADFCGTWAVDTSGQRKVPFHLIGRGNGWLHTDDSDQPYLLTAGDFVVFPHDDRHVISNSATPPLASVINQPPEPNAEGPITSLLCGYFEFQTKAVWPLLNELPGVIVLDLKETGRLGNTYSLIQQIISELELQLAGVDAAVNQLAYVLFIHVLRAEMSRGLERGLLNALTDPKIGRVLNQIHANPGDDWTVARLAKACGMSRSNFTSRFNQLVGMTPMRYVTEWRMQEAIELLQTTNLSIAMIAERCGYLSEVSFRKAFRSVIGEPPGRVRRAVISSQ
ncbi:MAG: AraC family transcriptional regulator [Gammaproteobacteria bacterium]|nr:AraC family transcriptional regulator [Gammaproteobacteria bacterium]